MLEHQDLLVKFDLVPQVGDHDLELCVSIIKESLVVLDLPIDKKILIVEGLQAVDPLDQLPAVVSDSFFLSTSGIILKLMQELHRLVKLFL